MNKTTALLVILSITLAFGAQRVEENNAADALVQEVQNLENGVREVQSNMDALWADEFEDCTETVGFRAQEIADAVNAYDNSQVALANCENALSASEADQAKAQDYVATINDILNNLQVQRETENAYFQEVVFNQLEPAIDAVNGVFPILSEFSNTQESYVQLTNHLNKSFLHMLKAKKASKLGNIFTQLLSAQAVGVSEETIEQLEKLFDDLLEDLTNEKADRIQAEQDAQAVYDTAVAGYNAILESLGQTLQQLSDYIVELNTCVQTETGVSASADAKRVRNEDALNAALELCESRKASYDNNTAANDKQLEQFGKLKAFIREQEDIFGDYGVEVVDAYGDFQKSFAETRESSRSNFLQVALKKFHQSSKSAKSSSSKCESCKKAFVQKKLGF